MKLSVYKKNQLLSEVDLENDELANGAEIFIGRSDDCHIIISDPLISRYQVVLNQEGEKLFLKSLSTTLDVYLSGTLVENRAEIFENSRFEFGDYAISLTDWGKKTESQSLAEEGVKDLSPLDVNPSLQENSLSGHTNLTRLDALPVVEESRSLELPSDDLPQAISDLSDTIQLDTLQELPSLEISNDDSEVIKSVNQESKELEGKELLESVSLENSSEPISSDFLSQDDNQKVKQDEPSFLRATEPEIGSQNNSENLSLGPSIENLSENPGTTNLALTDNQSQPFEDSSGDATQVAHRFVSYELKLFGEFAPLDKYVIDRNEVFVGRDAKKCQILLNDPEVSSVHAVFRKTANLLHVEDLNSSNGTLVNGQRVNKMDLSSGDEIVIGSTTFTILVSSDLIKSEEDRLMPVESGQVIEKVEEVDDLSDEVVESSEQDLSSPILNHGSGQKSLLKVWLSDPQKRVRVLIGAALLVLLFLITEGEQTGDEGESDTQASSETKEKSAGENQSNSDETVAKNNTDNKAPSTAEPELTDDQKRALEARLNIAQALLRDKKLDEAIAELEQVLALNPNYAQAKTLYTFVKEQAKKLREDEERLMREKERAVIKEEVRKLLEEAKVAVKDKNVATAEALFARIAEKDPDNKDVIGLKLELEAWQTEEKRKKDEEERKISQRKQMLDRLSQGKRFYLAREWSKAVVKLEDFLAQKGMDEDLIKEATAMLKDSRNQMIAEVAPLIGKGRSLIEGQDFKAAYETYSEILKIDPNNSEALNEISSIRDQLEMRSKRIYREAIISESLSNFIEAKEKLLEVQQISPVDSEYYLKATEKLKNYWE